MIEDEETRARYRQQTVRRVSLFDLIEETINIRTELLIRWGGNHDKTLPFTGIELRGDCDLKRVSDRLPVGLASNIEF